MQSPKSESNYLRILFFDTEWFPNLGYTWGKWEQNVIKNKRDAVMASFAWKWQGEAQIHVLGLPDFPSYKKEPFNDKYLLQAAWKLLQEADIIVAHNGDAFDIKKMNGRFVFHRLKPVNPGKQIDTLKIAKQVVKVDSYALDYLAKYYHLGEKIETGGFDTWEGCMNKDPKAWKKMLRYNKHDIVILEALYILFRPWIKKFPIVSLKNGKCPFCGGKELQKRGVVRGQQQYYCNKCHKWPRGEIVC